MNTSVTIPNLDVVTANWLRDEAQRQNRSVETLILEILHKEMMCSDKIDATSQLRAQQVERQYAQAYAQFPVRSDEFDVDESQMDWGDE